MTCNISAQSANSVIDCDMLTGLGDVGTDTGTFLGNLAPGIGKFLLILAVFGGVAGIIGAVIYLVRKKMKV